VRAATSAADETAAVLRDLCSLQAMSGALGEESFKVPPKDASSVELSLAELEALGTDAEAWWSVLEATAARVAPWVESSVEELAAEANSAIGSTRASATAATFKAVRQGPLTQCEHLLAQMPPGSEARDHACHQSAERTLGTPRQPARVSTHGNGTGAGHDEGAAQSATGELYDDGPFYHSLLKELLDSGSASAIPSGAAPKLKHNKRPTDNRQSKGRKLSYEVQPKLLNFMFPEAPKKPIVLAELFASVFGHRISSLAAGVEPVPSSTRPAQPQKAASSQDEAVIDVAKLFAT